jgi:nucleoside-diphosphate-sugar epimerase
VDAAKKFGVKRFVYFQTALCYGLKPMQQPIRLDHPRFPGSSSYAISKTANEYYIELSGVDFVTPSGSLMWSARATSPARCRSSTSASKTARSAS